MGLTLACPGHGYWFLGVTGVPRRTFLVADSRNEHKWSNLHFKSHSLTRTGCPYEVVYIIHLKLGGMAPLFHHNVVLVLNQILW